MLLLTRWSTRLARILCLLRRSLFAAIANPPRCFCLLFVLRVTEGTCASAAPLTARSLSVFAIATPCAIPRHRPACAAHQTRAGCDDKANNVFQGTRGLYIDETFCSDFGWRHEWRLESYDNKACGLWFECTGTISSGQGCVAIHIILKRIRTHVRLAYAWLRQALPRRLIL